MLVKVDKAFVDDFSNVVVITKENECLKVDENGKKSDEKTNVFRYRNLAVFVADCGNNLESIELFNKVQALKHIYKVAPEMLATPLCTALRGATVEIVQTIVNRAQNPFVNTEICSVKTVKESEEAFNDMMAYFTKWNVGRKTHFLQYITHPKKPIFGIVDKPCAYGFGNKPFAKT